MYWPNMEILLAHLIFKESKNTPLGGVLLEAAFELNSRRRLTS